MHLSSGDLLREERDSGSPDGELINKMILEGIMVPGEIPVNLIKKTLVKHEWNGKKYLVDGFPRNSEN